jgi:hypothetical protein
MASRLRTSGPTAQGVCTQPLRSDAETAGYGAYRVESRYLHARSRRAFQRGPVAELADAADLKFADSKESCGFDSHRGHHLKIALLIVLLMAGCGHQPTPRGRIVLATTTSVQNSGLLDVVLAAFRQTDATDVHVMQVGTAPGLDAGPGGRHYVVTNLESGGLPAPNLSAGVPSPVS